MLGMWVHESGHAVAAWLCGYLAWPGPWISLVNRYRQLAHACLTLVVVVYVAAIYSETLALQRFNQSSFCARIGE